MPQCISYAALGIRYGATSHALSTADNITQVDPDLQAKHSTVHARTTRTQYECIPVRTHLHGSNTHAAIIKRRRKAPHKMRNAKRAIFHAYIACNKHKTRSYSAHIGHRTAHDHAHVCTHRYTHPHAQVPSCVSMRLSTWYTAADVREYSCASTLQRPCVYVCVCTCAYA
jgi:hypothetical protein